MNAKFHSDVQVESGVTRVRVRGVLDEDQELGVILRGLRPGPMTIDLAEVERINEAGVEAWVEWLRQAEDLGARVVLVRCSPAVVAQINLVSPFTGVGRVQSFYAPYFCPRCDREKKQLLETAELWKGPRPIRAPRCVCDACGGEMEFDDQDETYFAFMSQERKIVTGAPIAPAAHEDATVVEAPGPTLTPAELSPRSGAARSVPPPDPAEWTRPEPVALVRRRGGRRIHPVTVLVLVLTLAGLGWLALRLMGY